MLAIIMVAMLSMSLYSCSPDETNQSLSVSGSVSIDADGTASGNIIVTAENTDWNVDVVQGKDWLSAYKSGNMVSVSATENTKTDERKGTIIVTSTSDAKLNQTISIVQKGANPIITVNGLAATELKFDFHSGVYYKQTVNIASNIDWSISGVPEWLNVSPSNGKGSLMIDIYPKTEYHHSDSREANLTISGSGANVAIKVVQEGDRVSDCDITLSNFLSLKNEVAFKISYGKNLRTFYIGFMEATEYGKMSEEEIISYAEAGNFSLYSVDELSKITYTGNLGALTKLNAGTEYVIITFGYNSKKELGDFTETRIKTTSARTQEPVAYIGDLYYSDENWFVQIASKEPNCWGYYAYLTEDPELIYAPDAIYAWYINQGIKKGTMEKYTGTGADALVAMKRSAGATSFGVGVWGYDSNDVLAGILDWSSASLQSSRNSSRVANCRNVMFYPSSADGKVFQIIAK